MAKVHAVTRAYLEMYPAEAARVLEHVAPPNCAALLNAVPLRTALDVLKYLLPAHAARCLEHLKPQAAIGLLRALTPQAGADLLRHLPVSTRESLLGELPGGIAIALRLLLSYPEDTVGAWIDTRVPTLPPDATVKEGLDRIKRSVAESGDYLYVVNADQRLRGIVRVADLVRAPNRDTVEPLARTAPDISARASLTTAHTHPGWHHSHVLAVIDHQGRFLGVLPYGVLARARARQAPATTAQMVTHTVGTVATAYWLGLSQLLRAVVPLIVGRRAHGTRHGR